MKDEMEVVDRITPEEEQAMDELVDAIHRGDGEAADIAVRKVRFLPSSLMAMKKVFGADFIRECGFNTEFADRFYGRGWLERKEAEPWAKDNQ